MVSAKPGAALAGVELVAEVEDGGGAVGEEAIVWYIMSAIG